AGAGRRTWSPSPPGSAWPWGRRRWRPAPRSTAGPVGAAGSAARPPAAPRTGCPGSRTGRPSPGPAPCPLSSRRSSCRRLWPLLGRDGDLGFGFGVDERGAVHFDDDVAQDPAGEREGGDIVVAHG